MTPIIHQVSDSVRLVFCPKSSGSFFADTHSLHIQYRFGSGSGVGWDGGYEIPIGGQVSLFDLISFLHRVEKLMVLQ